MLFQLLTMKDVLLLLKIPSDSPLYKHMVWLKYYFLKTVPLWYMYATKYSKFFVLTEKATNLKLLVIYVFVKQLDYIIQALWIWEGGEKKFTKKLQFKPSQSEVFPGDQ